MKNGLFRHPNGGKVLVIDGKERHFPPLRGPQLALDALPVWATDEQPAPESEFTADDAALAEHVARAVGDAIKSFRRKGRDESLNREDERLVERSGDRSNNMSTQNDGSGNGSHAATRGLGEAPARSVFAPRSNRQVDHRNDFDSRSSVTRDELDAAIKAALATDSRPSTRIAVDRKELLGLN